MEGLPQYWPILYVLHRAPNHSIRGATVLQKILAYSEVRGLPLEWIFTKKDRGSFSVMVKPQLEACQEEGLITLKEVSFPGKEYTREDYYLSKKGVELVEKNILPILQTNKRFLERMERIDRKIPGLERISSSGISKKEHKTLLLDDDKSFKERVGGLNKELAKSYSFWSKKKDIRNEQIMDILGMIKLIQRVINAIAKREETEKTSWTMFIEGVSMGKYYESELISEFLEELGGIASKMKKKSLDQINLNDLRMSYEDIKRIAYLYDIIEPLGEMNFLENLTKEELKSLKAQHPSLTILS
ncbi:MAG: hypothetical protein JW834_04850 [Candidatus Diapherotrites archaeon]|nr:hypothetical protein [Candidatus Diapherotrites archaeon]